jgi:hypothetical protein
VGGEDATVTAAVDAVVAVEDDAAEARCERWSRESSADAAEDAPETAARGGAGAGVGAGDWGVACCSDAEGGGGLA